MTAYPTEKLGKLATVLAGQSPPGTSYNSRRVGLPFYQGKKEFGLRLIGKPSIWTDAPKKVGEAGDIVMSVRAPVGPVNILNETCCIGRGLAAIRPHEGLDRDFLYYFLRFKEPEIGGREGAVFASINKDEISSIQIPSPPIAEQRRVVSILDKSFAGIAAATANAEKNLANARDLLRSALASAFSEGAASVALEQLCVPGRVITYGVIKLGDEIPGGIPCLRTSNVRWLGIEKAGMKRISPMLSDEYKRTILSGGEVLVNVRGTLGGVAVASSEMSGWNVSREVAVVPNDTAKIDSRYLAYWIGTPASQHWLTRVQKGLAYTGINIADLRTLPVPLCSLGEQQELADRLDVLAANCRQLEASYRSRLSGLNTLRSSILAKAFSGELTSQPEAVAA